MWNLPGDRFSVLSVRLREAMTRRLQMRTCGSQLITSRPLRILLIATPAANMS